MTSLATQNKEYRLFIKITRQTNSKKKTEAETITNSGDMKDSGFYSCQIILFKMSAFQKKISRHANKQKSMAHTQGEKKALNRNCP